ncbi:MAG: choice-of-anchor D domain-containing protein [Terriglobales bacterium]
MPLVFEPAAKSSGDEPAFLSRSGGAEARFTSAGVSFSVFHSKDLPFSHFKIRFLGTNSNLELAGFQKVPSKSNYLIGKEQRDWRIGVENFARVRYGNVYPGIDLIFYGSGSNLEHDFVVAPGAQPKQIGFQLQETSQVRLDQSGRLHVKTSRATLTFKSPIAYQTLSDGRRNPVAASFVLSGRNVRFRIGKYDHSRQLVIDPVLVFSTYFDGSQNDQVQAITTDANGNIYLTGETSSTDFPIANAFQGTPTAGSVAFVSKLDPTGHNVIYSTYLGGSQGANGAAIAVDANGHAIVSGYSSSSDFPQAGSFVSQTGPINFQDYFLAALSADGASLVYSGLLGGTTFANATDHLAVDTLGNVYLTGQTGVANFPITPNTLVPSFSGYPFSATFIAKIAPTGALLYSTLIPGNALQDPAKVENNNFAPHGIAVDSNGNAIIAGNAGQGLPTTSGVIGQSFPGDLAEADPTYGFVLKINAAASQLIFASYVPGAQSIWAFTSDAQGKLFIAGQTNATNLQVSANAFQKTAQAGQFCVCGFGYVAELDSGATALVAATYLTGTTSQSNAGTVFTSIGLDTKENVLVAGSTASPDVPLMNPLVSSLNTQFSFTVTGGYVAQLSADFSTLRFGSFISGINGASVATASMNGDDRAVIAGSTFGAGFPTTAGAYQTTPPPSSNPFVQYPRIYVAELDLATPAPSVCFSSSSVDFGFVLVNTFASRVLNVKNCGNAPLQINSVASSVATISAAQSCGSVAPAATCSITLTFSPVDISVSGGQLTISDNAGIPQQSVSISGQGGVPQVVYPQSVSSGDLLVSTQNETSVLLVNQGTAELIVSKATATGDFSVDNRCTNPVPPIQSSFNGGFCEIGLIFNPTQPGTRTGILTIFDNVAGSPHSITVSGNGLTVYPVPSIASIPGVRIGVAQEFVSVSGSNFFPASQIYWNGAARTTHYQDEQTLYADLTAADVAQIGEASVTVSNPAPGGGTSDPYIATLYSFSPDISFVHSVWEPHSGLLYASVAGASKTYPGSVIAYDPASGSVVHSWNIGNQPNQLAVSDDGQFLYVGLDGDGKVAQLSLPSGSVIFNAGLGNDSSFGKPLVADALQVLPGAPHSWAVTLCGSGFSPCGEGVAVFDDAVERTQTASGNQLQPDALLFVGGDSTKLFGTTLQESPSTFYVFSVNASGVSQQQALQNFSGLSLGGGQLDTDGNLIYVSNGQIIDPKTLTGTFNNFPTSGFLPGMKVDAAGSRIYFAARSPAADFSLSAYDLSSKGLIGKVLLPAGNVSQPQVFRWSNNGIGIASANGIFLLRTSLTSKSAPVAPFASLSETTVSFGTQAVNTSTAAQTVSVTNIGSGDLVISGITVSGDFSQTNDCAKLAPHASCQIALVFTPTTSGARTGTLSIADNAADTPQHVAVTGTGAALPSGVSLSPASLTFASQLIGSSSGAQSIDVTNSGGQSITISGISVSESFSQTNNCSTLAVSAKCTVKVVFTPTKTGQVTGMLTINDSAAGSPHTAQLSGTGADFSITASDGSSQPTQSIKAGSTATYNLSLNPTAALGGIISLACSGAPQHATCSVSPSQLTGSGSTPQAFTVSVSTNVATAAAVYYRFKFPNRESEFALVGAGLLPLFLLILGRGGKCMTCQLSRLSSRAGLFAVVLALLLVHVGCGGGGTASSGSSVPPPPPPTGSTTATPTGTYTIIVGATQGTTARTMNLTLNVQ